MPDNTPKHQHLIAQAKYYTMRERYDIAHRASQEAHRAMKEAERELVDAMIQEDVPKFSRGDGTTVLLRNQASISVTQENEDAVSEWLFNQFGDDEPFRKSVLDKTSIMEMIQSRLSKGELSEDDVPEEMKLNLRPAVTVRGWNARSVL